MSEYPSNGNPIDEDTQPIIFDGDATQPMKPVEVDISLRRVDADLSLIGLWADELYIRFQEIHPYDAENEHEEDLLYASLDTLCQEIKAPAPDGSLPSIFNDLSSEERQMVVELIRDFRKTIEEWIADAFRRIGVAPASQEEINNNVPLIAEEMRRQIHEMRMEPNKED